mgnify:CR=1 FL=1
MSTWKERLNDLWETIYFWFRDIYFYLYNRIHQSHLINTGLPKGHHYDKDTLLIEGILNLVDVFISKNGEDAFSRCDWEVDEEHQIAKAIFIDAIHYKHIREKRYYEARKILMDSIYGDVNSLYQLVNRRWTNELQEMHRELSLVEQKHTNDLTNVLKKVIEVRDYLWT